MLSAITRLLLQHVAHWWEAQVHHVQENAYQQSFKYLVFHISKTAGCRPWTLGQPLRKLLKIWWPSSTNKKVVIPALSTITQMTCLWLDQFNNMVWGRSKMGMKQLWYQTQLTLNSQEAMAEPSARWRTIESCCCEQPCQIACSTLLQPSEHFKNLKLLRWCMAALKLVHPFPGWISVMHRMKRNVLVGAAVLVEPPPPARANKHNHY